MKDVIIHPYKKVDLSHRIYLFSSRNDNLFASCSRNGKVTVLDSDFNITNIFDCSEVIKDENNSITLFGLHPRENVFYIGSKDEYRIYNLTGNLLCSIQENIEAVYYAKEKNLIWMVKFINSYKKEISLIIDDKQHDSIIVEDELYESGIHFQTLPDEDKICIMFLAGQDGMMTYFFTNNNGKIVSEVMKNFEEEIISDFSSDGKVFLSLDPYRLDKIGKYSYPDLILEKEFILPEEYEEQERQLGYNLFYLDNKYAIIEVGENLFYIFDTDKMEIISRFIVEGHEPKPVPYYWPTLTDDEGETTNLAQLFKTANYIISSYKKEPTDKEACSLVILKKKDILSALN